jgi:hypothetical protein
MKKVEIELYSEATGSEIVRIPERRFPGVVVQGDSLSILHANAKDLSIRLKDLGVQDEELLHAAQEVQEQLLGRMLHYQQVLAAHGIELPYSGAAAPSDLVRLVPGAADEL